MSVHHYWCCSMIILLKQKSKEFEKLINLYMTTWEDGHVRLARREGTVGREFSGRSVIGRDWIGSGQERRGEERLPMEVEMLVGGGNGGHGSSLGFARVYHFHFILFTLIKQKRIKRWKYSINDRMIRYLWLIM